MTDRRNLYLRAAEGDEEAEREVLSRLLRRHRPSRKDLCAQVVEEILPEAIEAWGAQNYAMAHKHMQDLTDVAMTLGDSGAEEWFRLCDDLCQTRRFTSDIEWDGWLPRDGNTWAAWLPPESFEVSYEAGEPVARNTQPYPAGGVALSAEEVNQALARGRQTGNTGTVHALWDATRDVVSIVRTGIEAGKMKP